MRCGRPLQSRGICLLVLVVLSSALLLLWLSSQPIHARDESYSNGGGPPGSAALVAPPANGNFAHRLRSSLRGFATKAVHKGDVLLHRLQHSRLAQRLRRGRGRGGSSGSGETLELTTNGDHTEEYSEEGEDAQQLRDDHLAQHLPTEALMLSRAGTDELSPELDIAAAEDLPSPSRAPPSLPAATTATVLPTPSQCAKIVADHIAGRPPPTDTNGDGGALLLQPPPAMLSAEDEEEFEMPPAPEPGSPLHGLVVATRFWASSPSDLSSLRRFVSRSLAQAQMVLVALNIDADRADTMGFLAALKVPRDRLRVVPVTPWLGVSSALNALALTAASSPINATRILFQSVEVSLMPEQVQALVHELDAQRDQLVVGAVLDGHLFEETKTPSAAPLHTSLTEAALDADDDEFEQTSHVIDGHNAPWNTAALWHLPSLLQTGFITVSDGVPKGVHQFGQEEVPTINLLQGLARAARRQRASSAATGSFGAAVSSAATALDVHRWRVTLLHVGEVSWSHSFSSASARKEWHARKMSSKLSRARHHMDVLGGGLRPGRVEHRVARVHHQQQPQQQQQHRAEAASRWRRPGEESQQQAQRDGILAAQQLSPVAAAALESSRASMAAGAAASRTNVIQNSFAPATTVGRQPPSAPLLSHSNVKASMELTAETEGEGGGAQLQLQQGSLEMYSPPTMPASSSMPASPSRDSISSSSSSSPKLAIPSFKRRVGLQRPPPSSAAASAAGAAAGFDGASLRSQGSSLRRDSLPTQAHSTPYDSAHEHDDDERMDVKIRRGIPIGRH
jgi:hypothetical protein